MENKNYDILKQIINDLKIRQYDGEKLNLYISRVVYSALSFWIRTSTLDEDILQQSSKKIGVSKVHILNRCRPFIDNMIELYPEIYQWFYPEGSKEDPIVTIRERLYGGGELVDVGFNTDLALPNYKECIVNKRVNIIRGLNSGCFQKITGLAQFKILDKKNNVDFEKAFKFYGLRIQSAKEILREYVKNTKWNKKEEITFQIFNKYCSNSFSSCWDNEYKLKNDDISLYKNEFFDFGFIRKLNGSIYTSEIEKYLIDKYEIRRFMYGLKNDVNNSIVVRYRKYDEKRLVEVRLDNALPQEEENILMLLGWPIENINDKYNLLFNTSIWLFIKNLLKNLNITLQEVK